MVQTQKHFLPSTDRLLFASSFVSQAYKVEVTQPIANCSKHTQSVRGAVLLYCMEMMLE